MKIKNSTLFCGDNLEIMRKMNDETISLIYADPPFNSDRNYAAATDSESAGATFSDTWTIEDIDDFWFDDIMNNALYQTIQVSEYSHGKSMKAYLIFLATRLIEMHRLLTDNGSIYLHCDPKSSHYIKIIMDCIFGKDKFRNEIVWCYTARGNTKYHFPRKHDIILFYAKSENVFNKDAVRIPFTNLKSGYWELKDEKKLSKSFDEVQEIKQKGKVVESWWTDIARVYGKNKEKVGYPTQKPVKLLERIIQASSNFNDVVLDPFCGSGTTCIAAERLNRRWIGVDWSEKAVEIAKKRINSELGCLGEVIVR